MKNFYAKHLVYVMLLCFFQVTFAQTPAQKGLITNLYDQSKLNQLQEDFLSKAKKEKAHALELARQNGWEVIKKNTDGSFDELIKVSANGQPIYYTINNVDAAKSTRANHLNSGGNLGLNLDGQNMTAYVWDGGGTRPTHQEFDGPGGTDRVSINDGSTAINGNSFHAMHVTGTIVASGFEPNAKGMAPQARAITYNWTNDIAEATTAAANGMLISNHSYGMRANQIPDQYFGAYIGQSRDWDEIMYNAPYYLMVRSGGNVGNDNSSNGAPLDGNSAYDKMSGSKTSKNNMVVANGQDANVDADGNLISVAINSSSSEGPTDDYRIKPDITGNGTSVYSTYDNSDTAYNTISGTSMASPNVAGTLLLLQQHANNVRGSFIKAATLKGVALHTADDAGSNGPDAIFGWGLLNARRAANTITENGNESKVEELSLTSGQSYQITVNSDGVNDLIASISWTDPAGTAVTATNSTTPVLVNDLDIRVSQGTTTYNPWRLTGVDTNGTGDNVVDPYERINVANASGTYTISITHKGSLVGGSQDYSLIVTGIVGTPVVCEAITPTGLSVDTFDTSSASLSWAVVPTASYNLQYRELGTTTWTIVSSSNPSISLTGLSPITSYEVQVNSECQDSSTSVFSNSVNFTTEDIPSGCAGGITSFPYNEGFENTLGDWTQSSADDINWTVDANGTPSRGTGPSSASQGSYYIYVEASGNGTGYPNKRAIINSPCYDLSSEAEATFKFDYHMFGSSNMGTIALEASSDAGLTWISLWSESGNRGNTWRTATVNLETYIGGSVQLRFNRVTGGTWKADIAIDKVNLTTGTTTVGPPAGTTAAVLTLNFDNYPKETTWEIKDSSNNVVTSGGPYNSQANGSTLNIDIDLPTDCYSLTVKDAYGDGMCCSYGNGSYELKDGDTVLANGGSFGRSETKNFCVGGATTNTTNVVNSISEDIEQLKVFPNPVKRTLNVSLSGLEAQSYQVMNMIGQTVLKGSFIESIDVSQLEKGMYMLQLNIGEKTKIKRFVKQ